MRLQICFQSKGMCTMSFFVHVLDADWKQIRAKNTCIWNEMRNLFPIHTKKKLCAHTLMIFGHLQFIAI